MSHAYKHSQSFAKLKSIQESIQVNLTSYQYLSVLDELLYRAVFPIIEGTRFIDVFLSQMLGWQTLNPKRKTSGLGRHAFSANTTLFLLSDNPKQKLKILKKMRLDRSMLFEILRRWTAIADELQALGTETATKQKMIEFHDLQDRCLIKSGYGLTSTYRVSHYWYKHALDFKRQILEKYTRMVLVTAQRDYEDLDKKVELDDIVQVYLLTAAKAIDKCDTDKGVITSHIQNWLMSAKNVVVATYLTGAGTESNAVSLSTTTNKRLVDDMVESVNVGDLEELSHSDEDARERSSDIDQIRTISKLFDPHGFGRILLHIQEQLDPSDSQVLQSLMIKDDRADSDQTASVNVIS